MFHPDLYSKSFQILEEFGYLLWSPNVPQIMLQVAEVPCLMGVVAFSYHQSVSYRRLSAQGIVVRYFGTERK